MPLSNALRFPKEFYVLVGLVLTLPLMEAPKNLLWAAYILTWLYNRIQARDFGGGWDGWDTLIVCWLLSGYIVAMFAGLHQDEWEGPNDVFRYVAVLWLVKRSRFGKDELKKLLLAVIISTAVATAYAFWSLLVSHTRANLELHSVGHVNHSAIYLAISIGVLLSYVLAFWKRLGNPMRAGLMLLLATFTTALMLTSSRAAIIGAVLLALLFGVVWLRRSRRPVMTIAATLIVLAGLAVSTDFQAVREHMAQTKSNSLLQVRTQIWNAGLAAWRKFPLFGVGVENHGQITYDHLKLWRAERGEPYDQSKYHTTGHAHNLYINTLVERGAFGFAVVAGVLLTWAYWLYRRVPRGEDEDLAWALWGGSCSAWFVTCSVGLLNTTLHHEHAILSVLLLGMWLSYLTYDADRATPSV